MHVGTVLHGCGHSHRIQPALAARDAHGPKDLGNLL